MTNLAVEALLKWLALPIPPELARPELDGLRGIAGRLGESDTATAARIRALVAATAGEDSVPVPPPTDDLSRALELLIRGERAVLATEEEMTRRAHAGEGTLPSPASAEVAGQLERLVRSSDQLRGIGVASALSAHASGWIVAHSTDLLGHATQTLLRIAVDQMIMGIARRSVAQAFSALSRGTATHGRADVWQAQVQHLIDRHPDDLPADLAWWVALRSTAVIRCDSRWFRAARTREQAEALLDLSPAPDDPGAPDRLDAVRVELAVAYSLNADLDERPWAETVDEILRGLLARLGQAGAELALMRFGELLLRSGLSPEVKAETLRSWAADAGGRGVLSHDTGQALEAAAQEQEHIASTSDDVLVAVDRQRVPGEAPPGVPPDLYDDDPQIRRATLAGQFGAWAFSTATADHGDEFFDAVPVLAELYTRGIADPVEAVREAAVVFARRLIFGYSNRDRNDLGMLWVRRVLRDTAELTSPRCVRARVQALHDTVVMSDDHLEKLAAADRLDAELSGNPADYAVIHRALLHDWRTNRLPPGPEKAAALEAGIPLFIESIDNDEFEQHDWPEMILASVRELIIAVMDSDVYDAERAQELTRLGKTYLTWMASPPETYQLHMLGGRIVDELLPLIGRLDGDQRVRAQHVVDESIRRLRRADEGLYALYHAYHRFSENCLTIWPEDRERGMARFEADMEYAVGLLGTEPEEMSNYGARLEMWGDWLFRRAEQWDSGDVDGVLRPYDLTARASLLYLRHGLHRYRENSGNTLNSMVRMAADSRCYLTAKDSAVVQAFYDALAPLVDRRRDGDAVDGFARMSKEARRHGRRWFRF